MKLDCFDVLKKKSLNASWVEFTCLVCNIVHFPSLVTVLLACSKVSVMGDCSNICFLPQILLTLHWYIAAVEMALY